MGDGRGIRIGPKLTREQRTQRDADIVADRAIGLTLAAIGRRHSLSRERVREVIARAERLARVAAEQPAP